ncbi:MAG: aspartate carbamoyltransferase regulatory subunit [Nanoarchaeota archaeon]
MANEKQSIRRIDDGLAIDHLDPSVTWKVARLLKLEEHDGRVSLGNRYDSQKLDGGKKGFLKIEGRKLSSYEINLIALVAPNATVNIISGGKIVEKRNVEIPGVLEGIVACANNGCVSNRSTEKFPSKIYYSNGVFRCHYCRHGFYRGDIDL